MQYITEIKVLDVDKYGKPCKIIIADGYRFERNGCTHGHINEVVLNIRSAEYIRDQIGAIIKGTERSCMLSVVD